MKKKPYSETRTRIEQKKSQMRKKRNIKIVRVFFALLLCTVIMLGIGWASVKLYNWGSQTFDTYMAIYDGYKQRKALREASFDPRFDGYTNILMVGLDTGREDTGQQADSIILLSFKHDSGEVRFVTIPRYTMVNIQGRPTPEPLNNAFYYGGIPLMEETVSKLLNVTIHHYVVIDTEAVAEIVDVIGGIDIYVDNDLNYDDPDGDLYIHIPKGIQHMEGDMAQKYLRFSSDDLGAYGRSLRQQKFLKAFHEKLLTPEMMAKIPELVEVCDRRIKSSIEAFDSGHFARLIGNMQDTRPKVILLPGEFASDGSWKCDQVKTTQMVEELFPLEQTDSKSE
ncbi:MAG: LCP family protein [Anaerovibrio sp.]|uniref:LCP family protein n=1 Tax=Anaerovibrio sp. TaxID=1872532 RepID=UPI0025E3605C|nr:LCP family protein [Anaerovibrio sp.]MCR5176381.1 LCP family protein [Anaerovibrio sp.]